MKKLLLLFILVLSLPVCAGHHLLIEMKDSKQYIYVLSEKPVIKFETGKLIIESNSISTSYLLNEILNYHFVEETTDVPEIEQGVNIVKFTYTDKECLLVNGIDGDDPVQVYDTYGRICPANIIREVGSMKIMLNELGKGIFIISINSKHTFKIYRQ